MANYKKIQFGSIAQVGPNLKTNENKTDIYNDLETEINILNNSLDGLITDMRAIINTCNGYAGVGSLSQKVSEISNNSFKEDTSKILKSIKERINQAITYSKEASEEVSEFAKKTTDGGN